MLSSTKYKSDSQTLTEAQRTQGFFSTECAFFLAQVIESIPWVLWQCFAVTRHFLYSRDFASFAVSKTGPKLIRTGDNVTLVGQNPIVQLKPSRPWAGLNLSQRHLHKKKCRTIPDICNLFYTGRVFKSQILHPKND